MKKLLAVMVIGFISFTNIFAQNTNMGDLGYPLTNTIPCNTFSNGSIPNFFDDAGAANYSGNYNDTITFCPDLTQGTKVTLTFGINAGFSFNVDGSDSIYVYDGSDVNAPFLGAHNSVTDPNGFAYTASWNNPSGCITVVFISDGATEGTGWEANISCGNVNQPFEPHVTAYINGVGANALNPLDTGFVDICLGDSILFVATPLFPNSFENTGFGYSQNVGNMQYDWYITDGNTYPNNDSIWFTPLTRNGFLVDLKIEDAFPQIERVLCKVRVSQLPSFAGTGPLEDTVCLGLTTELIGGVTAADTVGVDVPPGTFQLGGSFAGLTYLPDGSGAQYQAPITIGGFPTGATISNSQDLNQVCITIEHSYLGDLEIALQCPNGTQVTLVNSYSPGFIPGGFNGGGTFLGDADDNSGNGVPGIGWEYCFSSVFNTWGDMPTEFTGGNTVPTTISVGSAMNPNGVYLPEQDFSAFSGCPINGQWTIIVQDNLTIDDGYIFEWGLFFDPSFFPGASGYQNTIVTSQWLPDPTIVSGQNNDTVLVVQPVNPGITNYTFTVIDDFGCYYDTTVALFAIPQPTIFSDTVVCAYGFQVAGTTSFSGGVWSSNDLAIQFDNANFENPFVFTDTLYGAYTVSYTDNDCGTTVSAVIDFPQFPGTWLTDTVLCEGVPYEIDAPNDNVYSTNYLWSDGTAGEQIVLTEEGVYYLSMTNVCYTAYDTVTLEYKVCDLDAPNVISLAPGSQNTLWYVDAKGLKEFNLVITNRWGNVIYECSDEFGDCKWDGRDRKGNEVNEGTYFYIINALTQGDKEINKHGFIQVIR
ncbi:MAG: gliding motility-associated C-terminal domain-containing protein [Fluviicola sp.]|nr:gliding motility-associated C-terminal domain-containing protein [Fluviicola sp.]